MSTWEGLVMTVLQNLSHRPMLAPSHLGLVLVASAALLWSTAGYFTRAVPIEFATLLFWRGLFGSDQLPFHPRRGRAQTLTAFLGMGRVGLVFCLLSGCGMACFCGLSHADQRCPCLDHLCCRSLRRGRPCLAGDARARIESRAPRELGRSGRRGGDGRGQCGRGQPPRRCTGLGDDGDRSGLHGAAAAFSDASLAPACRISALLPALVALPFISAWPSGAREFALLAAFGVTNMGLALPASRLAPGLSRRPKRRSSVPSKPRSPRFGSGSVSATPWPATLAGGAIVLVAVFANAPGENRGRDPNR